MRDLPEFIKGLHDYIGKALAPLRDRIETLSATVSEQMVGVSKELIEVSTALSEVPSKADVRELIDQVVSNAIADPLSELPSKTYVEAKFAEHNAQVEANFVERAAAVVDQKWPVLQEQVDGHITREVAGMRSVEKMLLDELRENFDAAVAALDAKEPKPGTPGKSVTVDEVLAVLQPSIDATLAKWETQAERRFFEFCERAIQNMPKPKDGADGLKLSDATLEFDGKRTYTLTMKDGETELKSTVKIPAILDAGYWNEGRTFEQGDVVTCGGSAWIAQKDTDTRPEIDNPDWRLAVKKGRDARMVELPKRDPAPVKLGAVE